MGKGSKPAGNITTTQTNPTGEAQLPYLKQGWERAADLFGNWSSGQSIPTWGNPALVQGYNALYQAGLDTDQNLRPQANQAFGNAASGGMGVQNSPAYPYYNQFAQGTTAPQQALTDIGNQAQAAGQNYANAIGQYGNALAGGNLGLSQLGQTASGANLNGNPYFAQMVQNALDPITKNYQTSITPQIDANFMNSGRYGSGAMLGQRGAAAEILAGQLAKTSTGMYGENYARERAAQDAAAAQYGQLYNQGLTGAAGVQGAAANTYQQGLQQAQNALQQQMGGMQYGTTGLQQGYNTGNSAALTAAQMYPQLANAQYSQAQSAIAAGQGSNQLQNTYINEPWDVLGKFREAIGQPISAGGTTTQPYFQNQGANMMAGITGGLDIMSKIGGMAGLGAWIVCTELMRQGRMPWRYWAIGTKAFTRYPAAVQRGYYLWAIPVVRHLRRKPDSLLSRITGAVFRWRAEDLAARHGLKGARRLLRGRMVTWALYPMCAAIGTVAPAQDWQQVYRDASA